MQAMYAPCEHTYTPLVHVYAPLVHVYAPLVHEYAPLVHVYAPLVHYISSASRNLGLLVKLHGPLIWVLYNICSTLYTL